MKDWTVIVYMAGDNNLENASYTDLDEMMRVGSSERVNVVVLLDSFQHGAVCYYVERGHLQQIGDALGPSNTGDPQVLADFIRRTRRAFPATHNLLVIWNHGTGWNDLPDDFQWQSIRHSGGKEVLRRAVFASTVYEARARSAGARAVALDATSRDFLDNEELKRGLAEALDGEKLDVLGFDACLMATVEIAYQLRDQTHFIVGSQETEPEDGWPYEPILKALRDNPAMLPRQLSVLIVNAYREMGVQQRARTKYTQSALDLEHVDTTFALVQRLASQFDGAYPNQLVLRQAVNEASSQRNGAKRFSDGSIVDFYDWLRQLRRRYSGPYGELESCLDALLAHLAPGAEGGLVVARAAELGDDVSVQDVRAGGLLNSRDVRPAYTDLNGGDDRRQVHGVSIYLPLYNRYNPSYEGLDFAATGWGSFARRVSQEVR